MQAPERRRGLVGPLILIAVGILFLLGNLGWLGWNAWELLFRLWPIILIAVGLEVLIGRRSTIGSLIVLAVTVGIIGAVLVLMPMQSTLAQGSSSESINQPLEGASRASIDLSLGVGDLRVGAGSDPGALVQGTAQAGAGEELTHNFRLSGDTAFYSLASRNGRRNPFFQGPSNGPTWDLKLNRDVPTQLKINAGVGVSQLDLSQLRVTDLNVRVGVGKTTITMPSSGQTQAQIAGGVGDLEVTMPQGVGARVRADAGLGGVNVPSGYVRQDNVYTSPGYDTARNRVDLTIKGGVGRVSIQ